MHDPSFDGRHVVVTDSPPAGPFIEATGIQLTFQTYGFSLKAASQGRSMLVLPVQYSRCWSVSGKGEPSLFRANLMQLGVSFSGELDARLVFRYGPILAGDCRVADLRDADRLRLREARNPRPN
jgi:hypothetical protein